MGLKILKPMLGRVRHERAAPERKKADPFYTRSSWRALVAQIIAERGRRCEGCGKTREDDGSAVALIGDHIKERRDGGADLDASNVMLLCARSGGNGRPHQDGAAGGCHARKTAMAYRRRIGG